MNLLCRAKRKDNGEWVQGYYAGFLDCIFEPASMRFIEVYTETVCQFSGAEDDNDVMIFENDRVRIDGEWTGHVEWSFPDAAFIIRPDDDNHDALYVGQCVCEKIMEVIGNIADNPDHDDARRLEEVGV